MFYAPANQDRETKLGMEDGCINIKLPYEKNIKIPTPSQETQASPNFLYWDLRT